MASTIQAERAFWRKAIEAVWVVIASAFVVLFVSVNTWDDRFNQPWQETDAFFKSIGRKGVDQAYERTAPEFRAAIGPDAFACLAAANRLDQVKSTGWNDRRFSGSAADMGGVLNLKGGERRPAVVRMVRTGWMWKVAGLELPGSAPIGPPAPGIDHRPLRVANTSLGIGPPIAEAAPSAVSPSTSYPQAVAPYAPAASNTRPAVRGPDVDAAAGVVIAHPPVLP